MSEHTKNLLEYLREIYKLKTKVVTDYIKYDKAIDLTEFKRSFQRVTEVTSFSKDLSLEKETFVLKYIMKEKEYPKIPVELEEDIVIHQNKVIWKEELEESTNGFQEALKEVVTISEEKRALFETFKKEYEEIRKENVLIQKYNALYEYFYQIYKRKEEFEEKIEVILGKGLFVYQMDDLRYGCRTMRPFSSKTSCS